MSEASDFILRRTLSILLCLLLLPIQVLAQLKTEAQFILGPQAPIADTWFDQTMVSMARSLGEKCPAVPPTDPTALNSYLVNLMYYDLPMSLYIVYQRTGDPVFLNYARRCADGWWQYPEIDQGRKRLFPNVVQITPKFAGIGGLTLRALDGRPEMWDWITAYTQAQLLIWLKWRINNTTLHYGVREGAFALQFAVWVSQGLPDTYPLQAGGTATNGAEIRAQLLKDAEAVSVQYYGRLQQADGSWRWDDPDPTPDGKFLKGITQPFMVGLLLLALVDVHRASGDQAVKENIKNQILKGCRLLYSGGPYRKDDPVPYDPTKRWRAFHYLYFGGTNVNPTEFEKGGWNLPGINIYEVSDARQSIGPIVAAYFYAYLISGDPFFKTAGDELWDAAYIGTDGIRNLMNTDGKGYNQNARRAGSSLVWSKGTGPLPTPTPTPSATPTPTPTPIPSPSPSPNPSPTPQPTPEPSPDPTPEPTPVPCTMDVPASISVNPYGRGQIGVSLNSMVPQIARFIVTAVSNNEGQISVFPASEDALGTSAVISFGVTVKKRSGIITFNSPCGMRRTVVMVQ